MIGDPVSLMYYKGDMYFNGSKVILTDEYISKHTWNGKKLWKYARFDDRTVYNNQPAYIFVMDKYDFCDLLSMGYRTPEERNAIQREHAPFFVITASELNGAIQEFTHPIILERKYTEAIAEARMNPKKTQEQKETMTILWVVYILALIGSLIFKHFYLLWFVITLVFNIIRKGILDE